MRHYGRFTTDIWEDPKFRALTTAAQRAYFMLGTQADISAAGAIPLRIRRWGRYAIDTPSDALSDALSELASKKFVVIDDATEELLVRSFAKWDGGINNTHRRPVVIEAAMSVESPSLRAVLARELRELGLPDATCDAIRDRPSDSPMDGPSDSPMDGPPDGPTDAPSASDRVVVTKGDHRPQPATPLPQPASPSNGQGDSPPHEHEPNARRALAALKRDRALPLTVEELLDHAYRLGDGDPWDGYQIVKVASNSELDSARNPVAALRARLEAKP